MDFVNNLGDENPQAANNSGNQRNPQQNPQYSQQYGNPSQPLVNNQPQYSQQGGAKVGANPGPTGVAPIKKKRTDPREYLEPQANVKDDFLTHHLKYELSLSRYVTKKRIKRRQILEHIILQK